MAPRSLRRLHRRHRTSACRSAPAAAGPSTGVLPAALRIDLDDADRRAGSRRDARAGRSRQDVAAVLRSMPEVRIEPAATDVRPGYGATGPLTRCCPRRCAFHDVARRARSDRGGDGAIATNTARGSRNDDIAGRSSNRTRVNRDTRTRRRRSRKTSANPGISG